MQVRQIVIKRFRGIKNLNWIVPQQSLICLIGKGDATKSTILDAIEYALSPRWSIPISDADFYRCNTANPIEIYVTVGGLPSIALSDQRFGFHLRGWKDDRIIADEPKDNSEPVVTIKLTIDGNLEPEWSLHKHTNPPERRISSRERELLGLISVRNYADRDFSWGNGSSLSRLTNDTKDASQAITQAHREARRNLRDAEIPSLKTVAEQAQKIAAAYGLAPQHDKYKPALDTGITTGLTALTLHDGDIPLRMLGLGSKRLLSIAIQEASIPDGAILLLDEVEQGLEPYRLRNLLRKLREKSNQNQGQVFMTTHSPIVIDELAGQELCVTRHNNGVTTVIQVPSDLRKTLQHAPEAPLSAKIIVCEGETELGICRALDKHWEGLFDEGFAYAGVAPVVHKSGGGGASPKLAQQLAQLGYDVAFFVDGDVKLANEKDLQEMLTLVKWDEALNTEQRVFKDVSWHVLQDLIDLAISHNHSGEQGILDSVTTQLGSRVPNKDIETWRSLATEQAIRIALGKAAAKAGWFKDLEKGQALGELIASNLSSIGSTDLAKKIKTLEEWVHGNHP